jgi:molecular chaperone DnaJ
VSSTASPPEIKARYKLLVRKWHPDQFADDPQGMADATLQRGLINQAYEILREATNNRSDLGSEPPASRAAQDHLNEGPMAA